MIDPDKGLSVRIFKDLWTTLRPVGRIVYTPVYRDVNFNSPPPGSPLLVRGGGGCAEDIPKKRRKEGKKIDSPYFRKPPQNIRRPGDT